MTTLAATRKFILRDSAEDGYERVVMCELLIPDVPNAFGDIYTRETIKEFVYLFAEQGFGLDVDHDQDDVDGDKMVVVESFIARTGDPDFVEGSWVIGMRILDDELWQGVLTGEFNGFSFEADCLMTPVIIQNLGNRMISGTTEPDLFDGHTHDYLVVLNPLNKPVSGGTSITDGHSHRIATHTVTMPENDVYGRSHKHRYQVLTKESEGVENATGT